MTLADSLRRIGFGITATPKPVQKWIRLTKDEHERVKALAQECGISEAQTLRALVIKGMGEASIADNPYDLRDKNDLLDLPAHFERTGMRLPSESELCVNVQSLTVTPDEEATIRAGLAKLCRRFDLWRAVVKLAGGVEIVVKSEEE